MIEDCYASKEPLLFSSHILDHIHKAFLLHFLHFSAFYTFYRQFTVAGCKICLQGNLHCIRATTASCTIVVAFMVREKRRVQTTLPCRVINLALALAKQMGQANAISSRAYRLAKQWDCKKGKKNERNAWTHMTTERVQRKKAEQGQKHSRPLWQPAIRHLNDNGGQGGRTEEHARRYPA